MIKVAALTLSAAGIRQYTGIGFKPEDLQFIVSQTFITPQNSVAHLSIGVTDGVRSRAHAILADAQGNHTRRHPNVGSDDYCIAHYERLGGVMTKVLSARFVSFDTDGFTLNIDQPNVNYQIDCIARA